MGNELSQDDGQQLRPVPQINKDDTNKKHAYGHQGSIPIPPRANQRGAVYHPQVDLSSLSAEEQAKILSVMALAEDLDTELTTKHWDLTAESSGGVSKAYHPCALCHVPHTSSQCTKYQKNICMKGGSSQHSLDYQEGEAENTLPDADKFNIVPSTISYKTDVEDDGYEKEGEEDEDEDSDEELDTPTVLQPLVFFDRSPGEVYTIPEEDDELFSPSQSRMTGSDLNSDTASCLIRWRDMGQSYRTVLTAKELSSSDVCPTNRIATQHLLVSQQVCGSYVDPLRDANWQQLSREEVKCLDSQWSIHSGYREQNNCGFSGDPSLSTSRGYATSLTRIEQENSDRSEFQGDRIQNTKPGSAGWSSVFDLSSVTDRRNREHVVETSIPRASSGTISGMITDFKEAIGTSPTEHKLVNVNTAVNAIDFSPQNSVVNEVDVRSKATNSIPLVAQDSEEHQVSFCPNTNLPSAAVLHLPSMRRVQRWLPQPTMEQRQAAVEMAPKGQGKESTDTQITEQIPVMAAQSSGVVKQIIGKNRFNGEAQVSSADLTVRMILQEDSSFKHHSMMQLTTVSTHSVDSPTFVTCRGSLLSTATIPSDHAPDGAFKKNVEPLRVSFEPLCIELNYLADEMDKSFPPNTEKVGFSNIDSSSRFTKLKTEYETNQPSGIPQNKVGDAQNKEGNTISGKIRRKLPFLPQDQKSPRRGKDRSRNLSITSGSLYFVDKQRSSSLVSTLPTDDLTSEALSDNSMKQSDSEMSGQTSSAFVSPKKQISQTPSSSHLKSSLGMSEAVSRRLGLAELSLVSSRLPKYMQNLKEQLRGELRFVTEERKRLLEIRDKSRDLASILHPFWFENPSTCVYTGTTRNITTSSVSSTQDLLRKSRHNKRDTLLRVSPIKDMYDLDPSKLSLEGQHVRRKPLKALEFECDDQFLSYEQSLWEHNGSGLKEYVISDNDRYELSVGDNTEERGLEYFGNTAKESPRSSRRSEGLTQDIPDMLTSNRMLPDKLPHQPTSWYPFSYVSEDADDQRLKEEMETKIKDEIARRRQHLEEDCRLYDQLHKIARERDAGIQTGYPPCQSTICETSSSSGSETYCSSEARSSRNVFKAVDEILTKGISIRAWSSESSRNSKPLYTTAPSAHSLSRYEYLTHTGVAFKRPINEHLARFREKSVENENFDSIDPTFCSEELTETVVQRHPRVQCMPDVKKTDTLGDKEITPVMPLLPNLPAHSRKLLENLGCSPVISQHETHHDQAFRDCSEKPIAANLEESCYVNGHQENKAQNFVAPKVTHKYEFPMKRILLRSDRKEGPDSGNGLGMKIAGGREIPGSNGMIGAFIVEVSPGGIVETLGEVQKGDLILEWNGIPLTGRTYDEVQHITKSIKEKVEIVIQRMGPQAIRNEPATTSDCKDEPRSLPFTLESGDKYLSSSSSHISVDGLVSKEQSRKDFNSNIFSKLGEECLLTSESETRRLPNVVCSCSHHLPLNWTGSQHSDPKSNSLSESNKYRFQADHISGKIELYICYDSKASILYVTIIRARHLVTARDNSGLPDPFVKCFLFPVRCSENQKRTRYFSRCSCPEWKQTMMYPNMAPESLSMSFLEISVWNYDIHKPNEFLGEIILDLSDQTVLREQPQWYKLQPYDENHHIRYSTGFHHMSHSYSSFTKGPPESSEHSFSPRSIEDNRQAGSNQQCHDQGPRFPHNYFTAYCFIPSSCYNAVCCVFGPLLKMCPFLKKKLVTADL
ncbi:uncharacterized protein LOC143253493 isoform X2 [Tachypleus tridentatus]|uniref:uncharacterized protein LOC143253493 isoform X2 n=1 Tax=Tachypleus tridentatus TaxID=6853 RepID=UPI003FCFB531